MAESFGDQRGERLHTELTSEGEVEGEIDSKVSKSGLEKPLTISTRGLQPSLLHHASHGGFLSCLLQPWSVPFGVSRFLPLELALLVFSYLEVVSLARCMRVCRQWCRVLATEKSLWVEQFGEFGVTPSQVEGVVQSCGGSLQRAVRSILRPVGALVTNRMFGPEQVICIPAALEPIIFPVQGKYRLRPVHLSSDSVLLLSEMMYSSPNVRVVYQSCIPVGMARLQCDPQKAQEVALTKSVFDWNVKNPRVFAHCPWGNSFVLSDVAQMVTPKSSSHAVPDVIKKLVWLSCEGEQIGESEQLDIFSDDLKIAICSKCGTVIACREVQTEEEDGCIRSLGRFVFHPSKKIWTKTEENWELPSDLQLKGRLKSVFIRGEGVCRSPGEGGIPCQSHMVILCSKHEDNAFDHRTHYMDVCVCDFVSVPAQAGLVVGHYRMKQVAGKIRMFQPTFVPDERSICIPYTNNVSESGQLYPHFLVHLPTKDDPELNVENATFQTSNQIDIRRDRMSHYIVFAHGPLFSLKVRMTTTYHDATQAVPPVTDFGGTFIVMSANGNPQHEPRQFLPPENRENPSSACNMAHLHRFMVNSTFLSPVMADRASSDSTIHAIIIPITCKLT